MSDNSNMRPEGERAYCTELRVRFADVDAAGILFYPRYFELMNEVVEDWFESLGWGFSELVVGRGLVLTTRRVEADYLRSSGLGERLQAEVRVKSVGRTSLNIQVSYRSGGESRWVCAAVLVLTSGTTGRPTPWPEDLRPKLT